MVHHRSNGRKSLCPGSAWTALQAMDQLSVFMSENKNKIIMQPFGRMLDLQ